MSNILLERTDVAEAVQLFDVMKKYSAKCSLELNMGSADDSFVSVNGEVSTDYLPSDEGDTLLVFFGDTCFAFDPATHSFAKKVRGCQIHICISKDEYTAWFDSGALPAEAIETANSYDDKVIELNPSSDDFQESLAYLVELLNEGRAVKDVQARGNGQQVWTVWYVSK